MRDLSVAEHEAAHVVVGVALGLKLVSAKVGREMYRGHWVGGLTWFSGWTRRKMATGIMACAGIVWEGREDCVASEDLRLARECFTSRHDLDVGIRLAAEILDGRKRLHARIASELCDRNLTAADVAAMVLDV